METTDAITLLKRHGETTAQYLQQLMVNLSEPQGAPPRLVEAMQYSLLAGGKRLRPAMVMECFSACKAQPDNDQRRSALAAAAAIELVHTFSLVHDDLPAMDDDELRRGKPTSHIVFGEALAILAGDAMLTLAFDVLASEAQPVLVGPLVAELSRATGSSGMIGGQVLDIESQNRSLDLPALQRIHRMKTAALLTASCRMGAIAAGADDTAMQAVTTYGEHLGQAFQIVDDLLDLTATPQQLGKATRKDADRGKNTYPALLGEQQSRTEGARHLQTAIVAAQTLGASASNLIALANFVVDRTI
jgi:geranylgeranyl diphosphate synthase, type II